MIRKDVQSKHMVNSKLQIANNLIKAVKELTGVEVEAQVTIPNELRNGDFTSNVALVVFDQIKNQELRSKNKTPFELAKKIVDLLNSKFMLHDSLSLIEAKEPGFINFWLSPQALQDSIDQALKGFPNKPKNREVLFEFGDPNPFKEPHIGHMRNFILGESIARLLEYEGARVHRLNYQGDVGQHVAKALWGVWQMANSKWQMANFESEDLESRAKFLGRAYATGAKAFEESEEAKEEIIEINKKLYAAVAYAGKDRQNDILLYSLWQKGRKWSLDYFEQLYEKLDLKYEKYYFESVAAPIGFGLVRENDKVFEKDGGAYIFRGEEYGLHTRVFVTSDGYSTYEAKDLALAHLKDKDFASYDLSLIMTANEQVDYFKVLLKALSLVSKRIGEKTAHLSFGFVNLKDGKMSSRLGNVVPAFWLLSEVQKRLEKGFKKVEKGVLEDLTMGAVKWAILKFSRESNIAFSIDDSVDLAGNSGPYMQYTYARIHSVLGKSSKKDFEAKSVKSLETEELALARLICQFENVIFGAAHTFSPNLLTNYLFELAKAFNQFYEKNKIIGSPEEEKRLTLSAAAGEVLKKGLYLLGISTPEKI